MHFHGGPKYLENNITETQSIDTIIMDDTFMDEVRDSYLKDVLLDNFYKICLEILL